MKKAIKFAGLSLAAATLLAACGAKSENSATDKEAEKVLTVGVMSKSDSDVARWEAIEKALQADGITLKYKEFTDYSQPNKALADGEVDINAFQHYNFLDNWNTENKEELEVIAETYISPINLFSGTADGKAKYKSVSELPDGATIAVPNDPTNESRALYVLEAAGLIKLDVSGTESATIANIKDNPKKLSIKEVDASQTAPALPSVDAAVINNSYAVPAGVDYATSLYKEQASDEAAKQWINILAGQKDWTKSDKADLINKLVKAYHTDEIKAIIAETSNNVDVPVW
ncbi:MULTISPECIES: MetQ/NlpA family ABC transporter substrate-binding protein [unclassified Streptococcus]|uniref:MetQ/NlpA family ABC transporter substrate-binding protein n=1 Tax=unclassified Streptococcus TaxID=2608887 RepID=UPI00359E6267